MPRVLFTPNLKRHVDCPDTKVEGKNVRDALEAVFAQHPALRGYVVDDQGRLRTHMVIFVDGKNLKDRDGLSDVVNSDSEIYVMQALSGG
jgi:molybdopterin synthase sulfur carrier subunit